MLMEPAGLLDRLHRPEVQPNNVDPAANTDQHQKSCAHMGATFLMLISVCCWIHIVRLYFRTMKAIKKSCRFHEHPVQPLFLKVEELSDVVEAGRRLQI